MLCVKVVQWIWHFIAHHPIPLCVNTEYLPNKNLSNHTDLPPKNSIQDSNSESPTTIIEKKNEDKIKAMALGKNSFN